MSGREYKDILTIDQCNSIANAMLKLKDEQSLMTEDGHYYNNSLGFYNLPEALATLPQVEEVIKKDYPHTRFENAFTRIYQNGSKLTYHTDRIELYLTLSVCVFSDINGEWPLCVSAVPYNGGHWNTELPFEIFSKEYTSFITPVGSGVSCNGTTYVHWRDVLECNENQKVIQTFYHWNTSY